MIDRTVGHYRITARLGAGGMGEVFLAEDSRLDRKAAIKFLPADVAGDPDRRRRFLTEAKAASALNHPHVCVVYDVGETDDGLPFIAMEFVEGRPLGGLVKQGPLEISQVVRIAIQVADALDAAHSRGIVHRDIKPENITLNERGDVKVLDFGLAKQLKPESESGPGANLDGPKTLSGQVLGTPRYMSPEQALARPVDHRSDLFSLGSVTYYLITGRAPFPGANLGEVLDNVVHRQPDAMARFNYDVPAELERITLKLLAKQVDRRYQSARDLLVDLKNLQRELDAPRIYLSATAAPTAAATADPKAIAQTDVVITHQTWFWALLVGLGMLVGGMLALAIAATRVVLPYDETFVGLSRAQLQAVNPRLLPFMAHDRVSLAGTMLTIGILYTSLAVVGLRRGRHWAQVAVVLSACAGFATFFLFLGFGYFDTFHAFVTVVLFQFLLLLIHSRLAPPAPIPPPSLHNDRRWRLGLWGQLLHVAQAFAFLAAGTTIAVVGVTDVFVPEDLEFMQTTAEALRSASPRLVPLIAHDRASFGGMIVACGLCFLGVALWGFRRGERWVWWTLLLGGVPGYAFAIGVHFVVGYENVWHLTPAFAGLAVFIAAQVLSYPYLAAPDPELLDEWRERAGRRR